MTDHPTSTSARAVGTAHIRAWRASDRVAVIALWRACGLLRPWNDPSRDIDRALVEDPAGIRIATVDGELAGTAVLGYDGHRGWVYYLAVAPQLQRSGLGRALMADAEALLLARGCPKINLMVRTGNAAVCDFYRQLGYGVDEVVCMGKRLIVDTPTDSLS